MKSINTDPALLNAIDEILARHPQGISEFELMQTLNTKYGELYPKPDFHDALLLFQHHFYLKHCLFVLKEKYLLEKSFFLDIGQLVIQRLPYFQQHSELPTEPDILRDYYLDLSNLDKESHESVNELLSRFWEKLAGFYHQPEALEALGLTGKESRAEMKQKYRELAQQHHPDRGGDKERFQEVQAAWEKIK